MQLSMHDLSRQVATWSKTDELKYRVSVSLKGQIFQTCLAHIPLQHTQVPRLPGQRMKRPCKNKNTLDPAQARRQTYPFSQIDNHTVMMELKHKRRLTMRLLYSCGTCRAGCCAVCSAGLCAGCWCLGMASPRQVAAAAGAWAWPRQVAAAVCSAGLCAGCFVSLPCPA